MFKKIILKMTEFKLLNNNNSMVLQAAPFTNKFSWITYFIYDINHERVKILINPGMVLHAYNPTTQKAEARLLELKDYIVVPWLMKMQNKNIDSGA